MAFPWECKSSRGGSAKICASMLGRSSRPTKVPTDPSILSSEFQEKGGSYDLVTSKHLYCSRFRARIWRRRRVFADRQGCHAFRPEDIGPAGFYGIYRAQP